MPSEQSAGAISQAVADYCTFGDERVYILMAIARRKENPEIDGEIVFREVVKGGSDVRRKVSKLRAVARGYTPDNVESATFRLYLTANARNVVDGYFNYRERMNGWSRDWGSGDEAAVGKFKGVDSYWKSEIQKPESRDDKRFLFDLDGISGRTANDFWECLVEHTDVVVVRETPNGFHTVTEPFNPADLKDVPCEYELKRDGLLFMEVWEGQ